MITFLYQNLLHNRYCPIETWGHISLIQFVKQCKPGALKYLTSIIDDQSAKDYVIPGLSQGLKIWGDT